MTIFRPLPLSCVAVLACSMAGDAAAGQAQVPDVYASIQRQPMIFFVAKGAPDACGAGCSEWIAADGMIDLGAPRRLRALLTRLADRQLPIFFHSPGGFGPPAMEIGRLLRQRRMTAGVSRTVPAGCVAASKENCRALMQSGEALESELYNLAVCGSACVFALIGAGVRHVPPGARIGVHAANLNRPDFDGHYRATWYAQVGRYLREMGIADALFDVISRVPHESMHYLSRDEIAEFGIDSSEFQETRWTAMEWPWAGMEWPPQRFSVVKFVMEARGEKRKQYRTSVIRLSCAGPGRIGLAYVRGLASHEIAAARSIELSVDGDRLSFPYEASVSKIDAIETSGSFETRYTSAGSAFFAAAAMRDSIDILESDPPGPATSPRILKLSTDGLSNALARLDQACGERKVLDGHGVEFLDKRDAPAIKLFGKSGGR
jgi:hypothetical protein